MDLTSLVLAPVRVPVRLAQALDDLATLAERARRDPDPVEEVRDRVDLAIAQLDALNGVVPEVRRTAAEIVVLADALTQATRALDATAREIVTGGRDLTEAARALHEATRELIDGGADLTAVSERIATNLDVFRGALPRLLEGIETAEELERSVETVAETVEPLQGAAARVGKVTRRLSRGDGDGA